MNKIVNKSLLVGDMTILRLRQSELFYSAYDPFTKHRERI